jgi:hypothetical protein
MWRTGRDWLAGSVLVFVGALLLAERRAPALVSVIPFVVGLGVLALFLVRRSPAALLIGCVLTGAGVGVLLDREGTGLSGVAFLACTAAGFAVAWLLALLLHVPGLRIWPIVAALVLGGAAAGLWISGSGDQVRRLAATWWPVAVVALGVVLLLAARAGRPRHAGPDDETSVVRSVDDARDGC